MNRCFTIAASGARRLALLWRALALAAACLLLAPQDARADSCSATMTDVVFTGVSPVSGNDYYASGVLSVTCTWTALTGVPPLLLFPNVAVCASLGAGSGGGAGNPRWMTNGSAQLPFNLYTDNTYAAASIWGGNGLAASANGFKASMGGLLALGAITRSFTVYGKIPGNALAGVRTVAGADTLYTASFAGAGLLSYAFYGSVPAPCTAGATAAFAFQAKATVVNNCLINTSNLAFGANSLLRGTVRASAAINVQCTANDAYQVLLGGLGGAVLGRKMTNAATGDTIAYSISTTPNGPPWGDGANGTAVYSGTGTGAVQAIMMYGAVPAQATPRPGDYKDSVIATLVF